MTNVSEAAIFVPAVFNSESQAASFIRAASRRKTVLHADEAASWDNSHERFEIKGINHQEAYSLDGPRNHMAEEYVSRWRRAGIGIRHPVAGSHLPRDAQEPPWREDDRHVADGDQVSRITCLALYADFRPAEWRRSLAVPPSARCSRVSPSITRRVRRIPHPSRGGVSLAG